MTKSELIVHAERECMSWADGTHADESGMFLYWPNPNNPEDGECTFIAERALGGITWPVLRNQIIGGRNITRMSRIVGYYSRIDNWNPSKIGELKDRRRGEYGIGASA